MIRRVRTSFVPVAVNLYKVRQAKDAGGDLFRSVQKQKDQYQGIWIVSPDGAVLAAHHSFRSEATWTAEVLATIDAACKEFGPISPRAPKPTDPLPYRGQGVAADGGITLALEVRNTYGAGRPEGDGVIDSLPVSAADREALAPRGLKVGAGWEVPQNVARKLCRALSPSSDQSTMPRPEEVTSVELRGAVLTVEKGVARLTYAGKIAAAHTYLGKVSYATAQVSGVGTYDVSSGRLVAIRLVTDGTYRMAPPYDKELRTTAAAIEWVDASSRPPDASAH